MQTHEKRREAFLDIAAREPDRCHVVDALRSEDEIAEDIAAIVDRRLGPAANISSARSEAAQ